MKKLLLALILFTSIGLSTQAQILFEFDVEIETKISNGITTADVTIILKTGELPIKYQLMPVNAPDGEALFESKFIDRSKYKFKAIPAGMYLAKVLNKNGMMSYKLIEITE